MTPKISEALHLFHKYLHEGDDYADAEGRAASDANLSYEEHLVLREEIRESRLK